jgi:hypothetical protein
MGRIEHTLLDGDKPPIRPKTAARDHILPQESNEHSISPQQSCGCRARWGFYLSVNCFYGRRDGCAAAAGNQGTALCQAYPRSGPFEIAQKAGFNPYSREYERGVQYLLDHGYIEHYPNEAVTALGLYRVTNKGLEEIISG